MYKVELGKSAEKELNKLNKKTQEIILDFLEQEVEGKDPRARGKALMHEWAGHWRYRVGKYRIICQIKDDIMIVKAVKIGHRSEIYRR